MKLRTFYLIATIVGTALPYYKLFQFTAKEGWSLIRYLEQLFANAASSMGAIDLLISTVVFWVFVEYEGRNQGMRNRWIYMAVNLFVGLSAGLPLFLYMREKKLADKATAKTVS